MNSDYWRGRRVLVTGHTGFKGAWLACWLARMEAKVSGYALAPEREPNLWTILGLENQCRSTITDINDRKAIVGALRAEEPEIIFHLAAQSLVRRSYREPQDTFAANVGGVVSILHAASECPSVKAVVIVTSDKCYENLEHNRPFTEDDRLGGRDPYSASKGCAEIAAASMRASYFAPYAPGGSHARVATARAGNVIGGGDWSEDRLIPDIVRGCLGPEGQAVIRSPRAVRPWQHVLEPLRGYLMLAELLATKGAGDEAWNFGPADEDARSVQETASLIAQKLGRGKILVHEDPNAPHEAKFLRLDARKAADHLGWTPKLDFEDGIEMTAEWYRAFAGGMDGRSLTERQIDSYMAMASK